MIQLRRYLTRWNQTARTKHAYDQLLYQASNHTCWMPTPNMYREDDIGTKNIRFPDGQTKSVGTRKIRDTSGFTFYTFDSAVSLS